MTEAAKIPIRQSIGQILEMLLEVGRENADQREKCGISEKDITFIQKTMSVTELSEEHPSKQRLRDFLMSLDDRDVRKIQILMYVGRDDETNICGLYDDLQRRFPLKGQVVNCIMEKWPRLQQYFWDAQRLCEQRNIDIEANFVRTVRADEPSAI